MIIGIGIDIVHVNRMRHWLDNPGLTSRFFHQSELDESLSRGKTAALSLAARFAAKEAFGKALGTGLHGLRLKDIMVQNHRSGKPELVVSGGARDSMEALGGKRIHLSMTHEKDNAVAMVVIEGDKI